MQKKHTVWAYFYMPILFLVLGYGIIFVMLAPVTDYVASTVDLLLLNQAPSFESEMASIYDEKKASEQAKKQKQAATEAAKKQAKPALKEIPSSTIEYPTLSRHYGQLTIPKLQVNSPLVFGDSPEDLRTGVGQYAGSVFPGEVGTTLIAGHNTTDFGTLDLLQAGDIITIQTNYGTYDYEMKASKVARFDDESAIDTLFKPEGHKLILYTCYPMSMIGLTDERFFLYADLKSGPLIDEAN